MNAWLRGQKTRKQSMQTLRLTTNDLRLSKHMTLVMKRKLFSEQYIPKQRLEPIRTLNKTGTVLLHAGMQDNSRPDPA